MNTQEKLIEPPSAAAASVLRLSAVTGVYKEDKTFKDGSPYVSIWLDAGPHEDYITPTAEEAADFRTHLVLEIAVQIYREYVQYPVLVTPKHGRKEVGVVIE